MVSLAIVEEQLKRIGCNFRFWNRAEVKELSNILLPNETIAQCIGGQYEGGWSMLCATNCRVLLIDKKPRYLTLKDVRYDMITELDYSRRLVNGTISIFTPNKTLKFTGYNQLRLRQLFHHVQEKVMESRYHFTQQQAPLQPSEMIPMPQVAGLLPESVDQAPVFKPNLTRVQNEYAKSYAQHIPVDSVQSPMEAPSGPSRVTAYANMPLIMNGWRRRVYGYHLHRMPQRRGFGISS